MCQLCVGRISIFFVRWGKNKKHSVGQRVGLDAVFLQYGLYVFGHLSKWFVFVLMFKLWSVSRLWNGRPTIGYNVLQLQEVTKGALEEAKSTAWQVSKEAKPTNGLGDVRQIAIYGNFVNRNPFRSGVITGVTTV
jgi:hypothetical protein